MEKSADAFRTISEVADYLETPAHVLRFWESRFPQIKPVKRAGGRRYYRPADVALLSGIRRLLHDEGMTIRGVQKMLREQGVRHVSSHFGNDVEQDFAAPAEAAAQQDFEADPPQEAEVVSLQSWSPEKPAAASHVDTPPDDAAAQMKEGHRGATEVNTETVTTLLLETEVTVAPAFEETTTEASDVLSGQPQKPAITSSKTMNDDDVFDEFADEGDNWFNIPPDSVEAAVAGDEDQATELLSDISAIKDLPAEISESSSLDSAMPRPPAPAIPVHDPDAPSVWLANALRTLSVDKKAGLGRQVAPLYQRLTALRTRMAEAAQRSRS